MAALVDMELFTKIHRMRDHFNKLTNHLAAGYANLPESEGLTEIDALVVEERSRLTYEALADVNTGQVINHQAVQAWADSLSTAKPLPLPL